MHVPSQFKVDVTVPAGKAETIIQFTKSYETVVRYTYQVLRFYGTFSERTWHYLTGQGDDVFAAAPSLWQGYVLLSSKLSLSARTFFHFNVQSMKCVTF